jgi:predicted lipoprotein with Yx(FWY)xxD motif
MTLPAAVVVLALLALAGCSSSGSSQADTTVPSNATIAGPAAASNSTTGTGTGTGSTSTSGPGATIGTLPADTVIVGAHPSSFGDILVNSNGHTFYIYTGDTSPTATCVGDCAKTWPPVLGTQIGLAQSLSYGPGEFKVVVQPSGSRQFTVNGHPVYTYSGDKLAGDTNGQGVSAQWYIIGADGQPITKQK